MQNTLVHKINSKSYKLHYHNYTTELRKELIFTDLQANWSEISKGNEGIVLQKS